MITSQILDGQGRGHALKVNGEGEITVAVHSHPPKDEQEQGLPFRAYFTDSSNSNDMKVNGSTVNVDFSIGANAEFDFYIHTLNIKLADAGAALNEFGNLAPLTNGIEFGWDSQTLGTLIIHEGIKDNLEFFRLSEQTPQITDLSGQGADAIIVTVDLEKIFGLKYGVRLTKSSTERLYFKVRDNISGVDEFNVIAYGFKI